jgi:hypothetical protein
VLVVLAAQAVSRPAAQAVPDADEVVVRLHAYLDAYEPRLRELVADEAFEQRITYVTDYGIHHVLERRRLVSDMGFLRLPGGLAWLAQRSVRSVDNRPVNGKAARLESVFEGAGEDVLAVARKIADDNARFNLGHARSINVPTLPLDLLGRRHAPAFTASLEGRGRRGGRPVTILRFTEHPPGALVAHDGAQFSRADVRAWIADDGAVLRADVSLQPPDGRGRHELRVDFGPNRPLDLIVPLRLTETYAGDMSGDGVATYRNYRRFRTSARLVPPPRDW